MIHIEKGDVKGIRKPPHDSIHPVFDWGYDRRITLQYSDGFLTPSRLTTSLLPLTPIDTILPIALLILVKKLRKAGRFHLQRRWIEPSSERRQHATYRSKDERDTE